MPDADRVDPEQNYVEYRHHRFYAGAKTSILTEAGFLRGLIAKATATFPNASYREQINSAVDASVSALDISLQMLSRDPRELRNGIVRAEAFRRTWDPSQPEKAPPTSVTSLRDMRATSRFADLSRRAVEVLNAQWTLVDAHETYPDHEDAHRWNGIKYSPTDIVSPVFGLPEALKMDLAGRSRAAKAALKELKGLFDDVKTYYDYITVAAPSDVGAVDDRPNALALPSHVVPLRPLMSVEH